MITYYKILAFLFCVAILASCDNEGERVSFQKYYYATVKWYYYGGNTSDQFMAEIQWVNNDSILETHLLYTTDSSLFFKPTGGVSGSFCLPNDTAGVVPHLVLRKISTADTSIVLDTVVTLSGGKTFQLLQIEDSDSPVLYGGYDTSGETAPESTSQTKFNYYYSAADLPDSIRMVIYLVDNRTLVQPADTLLVYKGKFSDYVLVEQGVHLFQIDNPATGEVIVKMTNPSTIPSSVNINTAKGYSDAMSSTGYKFATALLYKYSSTKYKDQLLFSEKW